ncbi:MAG: hypothetical protein E7651_06625 [Ruminococcaceae bacterium]|nr:hypothetical protein [Oscillospiraceae bacterium]MBQ9794547.1 hypothetical protein [Clostridia bacterium]
MEELNKELTLDNEVEDAEIDEVDLLNEEISDLEEELDEYEMAEAARRAKKKKRIILIAGIAVGLAIAAVLIAIFAGKKKED